MPDNSESTLADLAYTDRPDDSPPYEFVETARQLRAEFTALRNAREDAARARDDVPGDRETEVHPQAGHDPSRVVEAGEIRADGPLPVPEMRDVAHRKQEDDVSDTATLRAAADLLNVRAFRAIDDSGGDRHWYVHMRSVATVERRYTIASSLTGADAAWIATVDPRVGLLLAELLHVVAADVGPSSLTYRAPLTVARALTEAQP